MNTLGPLRAHNAMAAAVEMYAAIVADYERQVDLLKQQLSHQSARADAAEARLRGEAPKPAA